jgi:hypothetical protein
MRAMSKVDGLAPGIRVIPLLDNGTVDRAKLPPPPPGDWSEVVLHFKGQESFDRPVSIFDGSHIPKSELAQDAGAFGDYVAQAARANQAYFDAPPAMRTLPGKLQYNARSDAFLRESVALARELFPNGLERDAALEHIDRVFGPRFESFTMLTTGLFSDLKMTPARAQNAMADLTLRLNHVTPDTRWGIDLFGHRLQIGEQKIGRGMEQLSRTGKFDELDSVKLRLRVDLETWDATGALVKSHREVTLDFGDPNAGPQTLAFERRPGFGHAVEILIDAGKRQIIEREFEMRKQKGGYQRVELGETVTSFAGEKVTFESPLSKFDRIRTHDDPFDRDLRTADFVRLYRLHSTGPKEDRP